MTHPDNTAENVEPLPQAQEGTEPQPLEERLAAMEAELADNRDKMMRALAEAENIRKRALKDREDAIKFAASAFAKDLLAFADNFGRALSSIPDDVRKTDDVRMQNVFAGLEAMERDIHSVFERHKIIKIVPLDEMFNPNFHEVMFEAPFPGKPAGMIIEVIEPGYVLHDRLLRPARVGIAKGDSGGAIHPGGTVDTQA